MNSTMKKWVAGTAALAVLLLVGGWFFLVSPKRSEAADLRDQAASASRNNDSLSVQLARLKAQAKDLPKQQAALAAVAAKIPGTPAMPTLIRSLNAAAADTGVELVSLAPTPPAPLAVAAGSGGATTAAAAPAGSSAAAAAGSSAAAPRAATGALQQIGVTINVVGSYFQVAEYLDRLESLQRAFRVTGFQAAPGTNPVKDAASQPSTESGKVLQATVTGFVYMTPGSTLNVSTGK
jgi:Tfp pilus assembly protein PilO